MKYCKAFLATTILLSCLSISSKANAQFSIEFDQSDFSGITEVFSGVENFNFSLDVVDPLVAGTVYNNPTLNGAIYQVFGDLDQANVPSGFPQFNLQRTIGGQEYFDQGSSLNFEVAAGANLADGLQASELVDDGSGLIFEINAREVDTGRFHPPLFQLFADGTGRIQNSNNLGGINPVNGIEVDVDFGDEFVTEFTFAASSLTLATATSAVPEPSSIALLMIAGVAGLARRRVR